MLVGIFTVVSFLAALGICAGAGAFGSLSWLWLLPAGFLGSFVALLVLWFLMLLVMGKLVKMDKTYEQDAPFYRWAANHTIRAVITLLRVKIHTEGLEKLPADGRFLLACNHLNDIDPAALLWAFPKSRLSFISKRENDRLFLAGPFLRKLGCQPINRENDREALKTILTCIRIIQNDALSIGVFPEGYVSKDKLLHPFRHGVFKIAQRTGVPIVVCTLRDTHRVLPNAKKLKGSEVTLHLVDVIPAEQVRGHTAVQLGERVYEIMARDLGPELVLQTEKPEDAAEPADPAKFIPGT